MKQKIYRLLLLAILAAFLLTVPTGALPATGSHGADGEISGLAPSTDIPPEDAGWHLPRILAPEAWEITQGTETTIIAVLDTGIDDTHPVLEGKVLAAINLTSSPTADDRNGHGTHVAGTIAGGINEYGTETGIALGCTLLNVKVANDDGTVDAATVAEGVRWAVDNGANIINISLTIYEDHEILAEAIDYAWEQGALVIAAAGNSYSSKTAYPAMYPTTIAVAALDKDNTIPNWSNNGNWVDVDAPGYAILSAVPENGWAFRTGTSMAAALVSGEAALLYSYAKDLNGDGNINDEVRRAILDGCSVFEANGDTNRLVNIYQALNLLDSPRTAQL